MIDIHDSLLRDVGVDLGRCQFSVTEQLLHASEISAAVEQMGRKAVPQRVWACSIQQPDT